VLQDVIDPTAQPQRAVDELGRERAIASLEIRLPKRRMKGEIRERAIGFDANEDPPRDRARGGDALPVRDEYPPSSPGGV
jgi:hypothetical protein